MGMESRDAVWYPADADADGNCDGHLPPPMARFGSLLFAPLGWNRPARAGAAARGAAAIADRRARMPAVRESMVAMPAVNAVIFYCCRNLSPKQPAKSEIDASTRRRATDRPVNKGSKTFRYNYLEYQICGSLSEPSRQPQHMHSAVITCNDG